LINQSIDVCYSKSFGVGSKSFTHTHPKIPLIQWTFMEGSIKMFPFFSTFSPSLHFFYQFPVSVGHTDGLG